MTSTEKTITVSSTGQLEVAITVTSYDSTTNVYQVLVEGRIRNVGSGTTSASGVSCSISGNASFTGSNFNFNLSSGETMTFISHTFSLNQSAIGNNGLDFTVHYGTTGTAAFGSNQSVGTSLAVRPSAPGFPAFSNVMPTSVTVTWGAPANNGGSSIIDYKLRRWVGAPGHGSFVDSDANSRTRNVTGLTPGETYGFAVYARNSSDDNQGYSDASTGASVQMLAGAWVRIGGTWKIAVPYIRTGGTWKMALPYIRSGGSWKLTN